MTIPLARTVRKLKQAISRRLPQRRDDSGLTTLEWLLIVAAVAGLAAWRWCWSRTWCPRRESR